MTKRWYVVRSKPHKELVVSNQMQAQGLDTYFPRLSKKSSRGRVKPFFPGYIFVRADLEETGQSTLQWMPHTLGLVTFGGIPASVPEDMIAAIHEHVTTLNRKGEHVLPSVKAGDLVEIRSGPFAGYQAIFDTRLSSNDRVRVLLKMLNDRCVAMELHASQVKPEASP